jgi:hypothetical protein
MQNKINHQKKSTLNQKDKDRFDKLKRDILLIGFFRRGSLVRRFMPCGKQGCQCQTRSPKLHGPYYQWTRKVRGKTVTIRLSPDQARWLDEWIANSRRLDRILKQMEKISMRVTQRLLQQPHASQKKLVSKKIR